MVQSSRKRLAVAARRKEIAALYADGLSQTDIAGRLGLTQSIVSRDLKVIEAEWRASTVRDFDLARGKELEQLNYVMREAKAGWERSQKPAQQARMRGGANEQNAERVIKNQVGDPRFLDMIQKCGASRRKLLGLDLAPPEATPVLGPPPMSPEDRDKNIDAILKLYEDDESGPPKTQKDPSDIVRRRTA